MGKPPRREVLSSLRGKAASSRSLAELAGQTGVAESELQACLAQLEEAGYRLADWQYETPEEGWLLPSEWQSEELLVLHCPETASTNSDALALMEQLPDRALLVTEYQRAGRGRREREWLSPPSQDVLCTLFLEGPLPSPGLVVLGIAGLLAQEIGAVFDLPLRVRWPNDLFLSSAKVAGILAEARHQAGRDALVVGVGFNVLGKALDRGLPEATTLSERAPEATRIEVARCIARAFTSATSLARAGQLEALLQAARAVDLLRHRSVTITTAEGDFRGLATGFASNGELLVRGHDGQERAFSSGEVHISKLSG